MQDYEAFRRDADELVRLYGELVRRLSNRGIRGVDELVALHQQVRSAVETIAGQEIDAALLQIATLLDRLRLISRRLTTLAEMKMAFGAPEPAPPTFTADYEDDLEPPEPAPRFDSSRGH